MRAFSCSAQSSSHPVSSSSFSASLVIMAHHLSFAGELAETSWNTRSLSLFPSLPYHHTQSQRISLRDLRFLSSRERGAIHYPGSASWRRLRQLRRLSRPYANTLP